MNRFIHQKLAIQFIVFVTLTVALVVSEKNMLQSTVLYKANYVILVVLPVVLLLLLHACLKATATLSKNHYKKPIFYAGAFMIVGCSLFDISITLMKSPDLAREANVLVTSLFLQKASLTLIYCYGLYTQLMLSVISIVFWSLFLKSLPIIIHELSPTSIFNFFNKLYFGKNATFKSTLLCKYDPLYFNASLVPTLMGIFLHRIYCGLDWLNLAPYYSMYSSEAVMLAANVLFIVYVKNKMNKKSRIALKNETA